MSLKVKLAIRSPGLGACSAALVDIPTNNTQHNANVERVIEFSRIARVISRQALGAGHPLSKYRMPHRFASAISNSRGNLWTHEVKSCNLHRSPAELVVALDGFGSGRSRWR